MIGTLNISTNRGERNEMINALRTAYLQARAGFAVEKAKQDNGQAAPDFFQHLVNALFGDGEALLTNDTGHPGGANLDAIFAAATFSLELQKHLREAPDTGALVQVISQDAEAKTAHVHVTYGIPLIFDEAEAPPPQQPGFMPN